MQFIRAINSLNCVIFRNLSCLQVLVFFFRPYPQQYVPPFELTNVLVTYSPYDVTTSQLLYVTYQHHNVQK